MKTSSLHRSISAAVLLMVAFLDTTGARASETLSFEKDIRPIFRAHCYDCHGATAELKGELDLRLVRFMKKGGESGPAILPGNSKESFLQQRIHKGEMPPGDTKVTPEELELIARWIDLGAPTARPEPESLAPGLGITPEERSHWAYQPIERPQLSEAQLNAKGVRNSIDALILKAMPPGLTFSPEANRPTLIKRVFLHLTGLPPSPGEMSKWTNKADADWYDQLLTHLLDSPHYGERWARHWLDVAGYADSEGATTSDAVRPWAWKYRDWVIRAINEDKPFDQFIAEQLAGDELAGPIKGDLTKKQIDLLTATGFLRMAADGTGSGANSATDKNQVMTDTLKIISSSLLSVSLQCAQCHDHRYDPIPQTDYFAIRAIFEPALDWKKWKSPTQRSISLYTDADRKKAAEIEKEAQVVNQEKLKRRTEFMAQALKQELEKYSDPLRSQLHDAYKTAGAKRSNEQKELLKKHPNVNITTGNLYQYIASSKPELAKFDARMAEIRKRKPPEEFIRALVEPTNHTPETKLFHRGNHELPRQTIEPAPLTVSAPENEKPTFQKKDPQSQTTSRRLQFARWLTTGQHPLVARSLVNRVWMHHFGKGIVPTPSEFGKLGSEPTHPELLDWLATEFVRNGWSLKQLHRTILTSATWRQTSQSLHQPKAVSVNPSASFYWRKPLIRLDAEIIRDRMLASSGQLDPTLFGRPLNIKDNETGQVVVDGSQKRRSLYIQSRRSRPVAMLQSFDAPVMETNCENRPNSTAATQSLMLLNGEFTLQQAVHLAERAAKDAQSFPPDQLAALPRITESAQPTWSFGYGEFDPTINQTKAFTLLPHWTGSAWQGGPKLPDPKLGWSILNRSGGHPDIPQRSAVRRWTAPSQGTVNIKGGLNHPSKAGNGVRGRIVSSRSGLIGEWIVHHGTEATETKSVPVHAGDTIDFITDSNGSHDSDSFTWKTSITLSTTKPDKQFTFNSEDGFHGPVDSVEDLPAQAVVAWKLALNRPPNEQELELAVQFLNAQLTTMANQPRALPEGRTPGRQAMVNLCQSLFGANEFLYIE